MLRSQLQQPNHVTHELKTPLTAIQGAAELLQDGGGDLSPERLMYAYRNAIFPWYSDEQPILWWSPQPRFVIYPEHLKISRSLTKTLRGERFEVTSNQAFKEVVEACAQPRTSHDGTWITQDMKTAYNDLHALGHAMSIECWYDGSLAGGLYGVHLGQVFFGESMFSRVSDASKFALVALGHHASHWGIELIDCQVETDHAATIAKGFPPNFLPLASLENCVHR